MMKGGDEKETIYNVVFIRNMNEIIIENDVESKYVRKQERKLYKIAYNGINKVNWIEARDSLIQKERKSTFLDINSLQKSGRDLQADLEKNGRQTAPREFVKLENIEY